MLDVSEDELNEMASRQEHMCSNLPSVIDASLELHKAMGIEPVTQLTGEDPVEVWHMPQKLQKVSVLVSKLGLDCFKLSHGEVEVPVCQDEMEESGELHERGNYPASEREMDTIPSVPSTTIHSPESGKSVSNKAERHLQSPAEIVETIKQPSQASEPDHLVLRLVSLHLYTVFGDAEECASPPIRYIEPIFRQKPDPTVVFPMYWNIFLSNHLCDWLEDENTFSGYCSLGYIELRCANPELRLANMRWEVTAGQKAKMTRMVIPPHTPSTSTRLPLPLDWIVLEFRYAEDGNPLGGSDANCRSSAPSCWILAFPIQAVVKSVRIKLSSGGKDGIAWSLMPKRLPIAHGRGVCSKFVADFMTACVSGAGVVEIGR